ncbi:MAG: T9SS type A sorting domain-containing protein, partial [Saprospiraceae bacterium]|nr:T9SS type A sorting domain-containing protein [Saprospiraceae bacterium]
CTTTTCATVTCTPPNCNLTVSSAVTSVSCFGGSNGSINISTTGGTAPLTYLWSNGATTEDLNNLTAGTYCVTVTDANGCTATTCATVTQPTQLQPVAAATPTVCGQATGSINLTVSGGTPGYTYVWSNGATTQDLANLSEGTYCVTITDANGCTTTTCATVTCTPPNCNLTVSSAVTSVSCFGGNNGSINIITTGGTAPLTYLWSNGATTEDLNNLTAGTYCVTVTDANGCTASTCATVTQPTALTPVAIATATACNQSTGSITVTVSGGTPGYTYQWANGATTANLNNLPEGTYCVTVTDANGCTKAACATITCNPGGCDFEAIASQLCAPGCDQANGKILVDVSGGTAPYSYTWTNGGSSGSGLANDDPFMILGLLPGNYSITVTDAEGCTSVTNTTVQPSTGLAITALPICATTCGGTDGKILIDVLNGIAGYTYTWTNGSQSGSGNSATEPFYITGLEAGTYSITVTGADGCSGTIVTTITHLSVLSLTATGTGGGCDGSTSGSINVEVTSGTGPFTYEWSNGANSGSGTASNNTFTINGLSSGNYSITVTDANGCGAVTTAALGGNLGGQAFNDYNTDGIHDQDEPGLGNVKVYLYACDSDIPVDSAITDADGYYLFESLDNFPYRVEFVAGSTVLHPSFQGPDNGTSVQFVTAADCGVNVSFYNPEDYCQEKPDVAFAAFTQGRADLVNQTAVGLYPYDADQPEFIFGNVLASDQVGSVYGLAWDPQRKYLYASAFLKRHVGLGDLGLGGIYRIDYSDVYAPVVTPLVEVPNVGTVDRPDLGSPTTPSLDSDVFGKIGKAGLGDIDLSADKQTLWTVNLNTRRVVRIDNILTGTPVVTEMDIESAPNCNNGVFRPLGLELNKGKLYVGGVCTGENNGSGADLSASVHACDLATGTWTTVLDFDLTGSAYNHGDIIGSVNPNLQQCKEWETWVDEYSERNLVANTGSGEPSNIDADGNFEIVGGGLTGAEFRCRGQAMLSDIEITRDGIMVIALMDRTGHQFGYRQFRPNSSLGNPISAANGGDIIAAWYDGNDWLLENNGTIPGINRTSLYGVGNNEGPGGGEFFFDNTRYVHLDADAGGLLAVPGTNEVLGAIVNPNTSEYTIGGGVAYYDLLNGSNTRNDMTLVDPIFNQVGIGKANSVGDLEALCDEAPLQIGNRVWSDKDCDGVQDACEAPIAGVFVSLYNAAGQQLATTTTNSAGEYYFTGLGTPGENWILTSGFDSIMPNTTYNIVFGTNGVVNQFDAADAKLEVAGRTYHLTVANSGEGNHPDLNDSDALLTAGSLPTITYTTGLAGWTDHSLDAGFCPESNVLVACEEPAGSNSAWFNFDEATAVIDPLNQYTVSYHTTQVAALAGASPLPNPYYAADSTVVFVRLFNPANSTTLTETLVLRALAAPVAYISQLHECPIVFDGTEAVFNLHDADVQVTGGVSGLTVTYYISDTEAELGINPITSATAYTSVTKNIWARIENAAGCYDIDIVQLLVLPSPGVVLFDDETTCTGAGDGELTAIVFDGPAPYTYKWSNGANFGPTNAPFSTLGGLGAGMYTLTLTDGNGCSVVATGEVENGQDFVLLPLPNLGPLCPGTQVGPITMQTNIFGASYTWTGGTAVGLNDGAATAFDPTIPAFAATNGTATVIVTATFGQCVDNETFTITASDAMPPAFQNCPGMIMVANDVDQCSAKINWTAPYATDNCGPVTVTQTSGPASGSVIPVGPAQTVVYTATDLSGNTATCSFDVMVMDMQAPDAVCQNIQVSLGADGTVTIQPQQLDGGSSDNCPGALTISASQTVFFISDIGMNNVTLTVTDAAGNVSNCVATVTVLEPGIDPVAAFTVFETQGCAPMQAEFYDQSAGNPTAWLWTFPGGTPYVSTLQNPVVTYPTPGNYPVSLTVTNANGETNSVTLQNIVTVETMPQAGFTAQLNATTANFTNLSQHAQMYHWDFGDGTESFETNPVHTYPTTGYYEVELTAMNGCGISVLEKSVTLSVTGTGDVALDESFQLFPNPNDGRFTVEMSGRPQDEVEFILYNAIGQLIKREVVDYHTGNLKHGFDFYGLPAGVYNLSVRSGERTRTVKVTIQ